MYSDSSPARRPEAPLEILLDGQMVFLPPRRRSLAAIRSYLETIALEQQRFLCSFWVDGQPLGLGECLENGRRFARVEGKTIDLAHVPLQIVNTARQQISKIRDQVSAAVTRVMINDSRVSREHWWNLARDLKQPLLTLSLMPASSCALPNGSASLLQLRKWQLQQLASIIKDVDETCWSFDPTGLSDSLERRVLPWLDGLRATLDLWHETLATATLPSSEPGLISGALHKPQAEEPR
jgi:hypothetical protein